MTDIAELAAVAFALTLVGMVAARQLGGLVGLYRQQSLLLAVIAADLAWQAGDAHLWLTAALTALLKAGVIPWLLARIVHREVHEKRELSPLVVPWASLALAGGLGAFGLWAGRGLAPASPSSGLAEIGLASFLVSLLVIGARREALPQVVGLLAAENGVILVALGAVPGLPTLGEVGLFFDAVVGALVMGLLVRRMHEELQHTDTSRLKELRG